MALLKIFSDYWHTPTVIAILLVTCKMFGQVDLEISSLSETNQRLYQETIVQCKAGTPMSAIGISLNVDTIVKAFLDFDLESRLSHGLLSEHVYRQRHSDGFTLALKHCYGYQYGQLNRGLLMKNLIDMGWAASEVTAIVGMIFAGRWLSPTFKELSRIRPLAFKIAMAGYLSFLTNRVYYLVVDFYFTKATEEEKKRIRDSMSSYFGKFDSSNTNLIQKNHAILEICNERLSMKNQSTEARNSIEITCANLKKATADQEAILRRVNDLFTK